MTKPQRNQHDGKIFEKTDDDAYGSAFIKAAVDHIFYLEKYGKSENKLDRVLKCSTQRSGDIIDDIRLRLNQPDPLYFSPIDFHHEEKHRIVELLKVYKGGLNIEDLQQKSKIGRTLCYGILKELYNSGVLEKSKGKRKNYWLKEKV